MLTGQAPALIQGRRARVEATSSVLKNTNVRFKDTINQVIPAASVFGSSWTNWQQIFAHTKYFPSKSLLLVECMSVKNATNFCFCYPRRIMRKIFIFGLCYFEL
ncbi:unnamed protein product [Camellia sinensis]